MKNTDRNSIIKNGIWLLVLQGFNTVLPLITIPYITRVLGAGQYGVFSLALNWVLYFQVVVEYGFTLTGARKIALLGDDKVAVQLLHDRITTARLGLSILCFILINLLGVISGFGVQHHETMLVLFLMILGTAFQQTWLFQGKQEMGFITVVNAVARTLSVVLIFLLVADSSQVLLYAFLYSVTYVLSSMIMCAIAYLRYGITIHMASIPDTIGELKDGWAVFVSAAFSKIFSGFGVTVLGFLAADVVVGAYSAVYKIPFVLTMLFSPVSQAMFPNVSKRFGQSAHCGLSLVKKVSIPVVTAFMLICAAIIVWRTQIVTIVLGEEYGMHSFLITPLCIWALVSIINNFLGVQCLVGSGHQKEYSHAFYVGSIAIVVSNIVLGGLFESLGVAIATLFSELVLTIVLLYQCGKVFHLGVSDGE